MTAALVLVSMFVATAAAWMLSHNRRSVSAYALVLFSLALLLASQTVVKAAFTWLALLGLAGFIVTIARGLLSGREDAVSDP